MDAQEYLDRARTSQKVLRLAHFEGADCDCRANALIVDEPNKIAVLLEDCGFKDSPIIAAGSLVRYAIHPEAEPKVIGRPANIRP